MACILVSSQIPGPTFLWATRLGRHICPHSFFQVLKRPRSCKGIQGNRAYVSLPSLPEEGGVSCGWGDFSHPQMSVNHRWRVAHDRVFTPLSFQATLATYHFPAVNERSLRL